MMLDETELDKLKQHIAIEDQTYNFSEAYHKLLWSNGLSPEDNKKTIAGMLAVMYQFKSAPESAIAAAQWRLTKDIYDDQGRPGQFYFDLGYNLFKD
jgi:hypothetical protein